MEAAPHRAPASPCRGKPGKATRCLPDLVSSNKEGNKDLPRCLYRMATIKPDLHASDSLEGQSLRMQDCGEERQPRNENIPTPPPPKRRERGFAATSSSHGCCSNPTRMRVKAPKGNHCACRTAGKNGSHATKTSRPRPLQRGRHEDLPRRLRRMAAIKPDPHASENPEG